MKKILFLLSILSFSFSYGQTTLANKLRITGNTTSATATKVNVQEANGEVNTIAKSDLTDVLKYATASAFPLTGVVGKLYYDIATDLYYKWDGATYEEFGAGGTETDPLALKIASNLGDLASASTARTNLGLGTLATQNGTFISPSIVPLDEGGGIGHVINGRTSANYGNIGLYATDLSFSDATSSVRGATGQSSFTTGSGTRASNVNAVALNGNTIASAFNSLATGNATTASNQEATAMGGFTTSSGQRSMAINSSNTASGYASFVANENNTSPSYGETVVGVNATTYTPSSATTFNSGDRQFTVGIGASSGARADGLQVMKNGIVTTPSLTQALIDADATGKILTTKEWVQANSGGSGSTNLSTTYAPTTVTIVSSSGTDATVNAVDNTTAGVVTPTQKSDWDAKQTASQVTTAISSRISNDPYDSGWIGDNNAANKAVLYDKFELTDLIIADKQPLSAVLTATTASFTTADEFKLDGIATGATANSSDATLLARANHTGTQPASTISDFNTETDTRIGLASINALSDVNISSPATNHTLVYDGIGEFRNALLSTTSLSNFDSATRAQVELELVAGANTTITPSGTGASRQLTIASTNSSTSDSGAYTGSITWGTTAPTTILNNTFEWQNSNNLVTLRINLSYNSPATNQTVTIALPSGAPAPKDITGFTGASNNFGFGSGMMYNDIATLPASAGRYCLLRRNSANNGFEIVVTHGSAISVKTVALTIQYFAQ